MEPLAPESLTGVAGIAGLASLTSLTSFRPALSPAHLKRLHDVWRSAGWPCADALELELLAGGWLTRHWDDAGRPSLRASDGALQQLAAKRRRHQQALSAHESLVARVALEMQRAGRVVWRGLSLRAPLPGFAAAPKQPAPGETQHSDEPPPTPTRWVTAMPDVFSIRNTTVEDYVEPVVHEIKVSRSDLRADLMRADKGLAYLALSGQCWYVLQRGIAQVEEVPAHFGVIWADPQGLEVARSAPRRAMRLGFAVWMALAKARAEQRPDEDGQTLLGADQGP